MRRNLNLSGCTLGEGSKPSGFNFEPRGTFLRLRVLNTPRTKNMDMEKRSEIYFKRDEKYDNAIAKLDVWEGSARNKELIKKFDVAVRGKGSQEYRAAKLINCLRLISDIIGKDLDTLDKDDAESFRAYVNSNQAWSRETKRDYIRNFKQFFRWYEDDDSRLYAKDEKVRREARKFYKKAYEKNTLNGKKKRDYSNILTDDDRRVLIEKGCSSSMERALVCILHEWGLRVGELLNMRIKDYQVGDKYAKITVDGKTGERTLPVLLSIPYLNAWLVDHPDKDNREALMWISTHNGHYGQPLRHIGVLKLLNRVFDKAGINKKHNPHWFRHSRATILGEVYTQAVLCKFMGWEQGSKMAGVYCHTSEGQAERQFRQMNGLEEEKDKDKPVECICGTINDHKARYCHKCSKPLTVSVVMEDEQLIKQQIDERMAWFMDEVLKSPSLLASYKRFKQRSTP